TELQLSTHEYLDYFTAAKMFVVFESGQNIDAFIDMGLSGVIFSTMVDEFNKKDAKGIVDVSDKFRAQLAKLKVARDKDPNMPTISVERGAVSSKSSDGKGSGFVGAVANTLTTAGKAISVFAESSFGWGLAAPTPVSLPASVPSDLIVSSKGSVTSFVPAGPSLQSAEEPSSLATPQVPVTNVPESNDENLTSQAIIVAAGPAQETFHGAPVDASHLPNVPGPQSQDLLFTDQVTSNGSIVSPQMTGSIAPVIPAITTLVVNTVSQNPVEAESVKVPVSLPSAVQLGNLTIAGVSSNGNVTDSSVLAPLNTAASGEKGEEGPIVIKIENDASFKTHLSPDPEEKSDGSPVKVQVAKQEKPHVEIISTVSDAEKPSTLFQWGALHRGLAGAIGSFLLGAVAWFGFRKKGKTKRGASEREDLKIEFVDQVQGALASGAAQLAQGSLGETAPPVVNPVPAKALDRMTRLSQLAEENIRVQAVITLLQDETGFFDARSIAGLMLGESERLKQIREAGLNATDLDSLEHVAYMAEIRKFREQGLRNAQEIQGLRQEAARAGDGIIESGLIQMMLKSKDAALSQEDWDALVEEMKKNKNFLESVLARPMDENNGFKQAPSAVPVVYRAELSDLELQALAGQLKSLPEGVFEVSGLRNLSIMDLMSKVNDATQSVGKADFVAAVGILRRCAQLTDEQMRNLIIKFNTLAELKAAEEKQVGEKMREVIRSEKMQYEGAVTKLTKLRSALNDAIAAIEPPKEVGGINLSDKNLTINLKVDGNGMPLSPQFQDPAMVNIEGLTPIIREISPASAVNIPALSEFSQVRGAMLCNKTHKACDAGYMRTPFSIWNQEKDRKSIIHGS
ncbi:MAG: hypothetical protein HQL21_03340, partial [Candidatus Omnitrophica bacterium]|nr:hypothetical protein [Candidatus Omnitrophota bacterium]